MAFPRFTPRAAMPHDPRLKADATQSLTPTDDGTTASEASPDTTTGLPHGGAAPAAGSFLAGRYVLGDVLGEGGMGTVFRAEQLQPVRRSVAVKLIKPGMDSQQVLLRFEAERQALAIMDHPNIARVLDAGTTDRGHPFFVMELVAGEPLTAYCDDVRMTVRHRLELLLQVCQAVQHAHAKGVMHRDLKPSNILVTEVDGRPVPKVIDFGLAKVLQAGALSDLGLETIAGSVLGTPLYMAPEQAGRGEADIDTRADVYALGVILYELLVGSTPVRRGASHDELLRQVREADTPSPTSRLRSTTEPSIASARSTDPERLAREVRGDLEWVVLKCLEKDRERRYETPAALADDLRHFLADEPVSVGPPSRQYKLRKFVRRNRGPVAAGALVLLALVLGTIGTSLGLLLAWRQGQAAKRSYSAEVAQRTLAEKQARRAESVAAFMTKILNGAGPRVAQGRDAKLLKELVDDAAARLDKEGLADDPEAEVEMRQAIGIVYRDLADYPSAERHFTRAAAVAAQVYGPDDLRTLELETDIGGVIQADGRHQERLALGEKVVAACARTGNAETRVAALGWVTIGSARYYIAGGWTDESEKANRTGLAVARKALPPGDPELALYIRSVASSCSAHTAHVEALALNREAYDLHLAVHGRLHPATIQSACLLADSQHALSRSAESEKLMRETLTDAETVFGPNHPNVADVLWRLGNALNGKNDSAAAVKTLDRCLAIRRAVYPGPNLDVASALAVLAHARELDGDPAGAEPMFREVIGMRKALLGRVSPAVGSALEGLGSCLRRLNRFNEAEEALIEARAAFSATLPDPIHYPNVLFELAMVAQGRNDLPKAIDLFGQVVEVNRRLYGPEHLRVAEALANRAAAKFRANDKAGAEADLREAAALVRKHGQPHSIGILCLGNLQFVLQDKGDWAGAEPFARETVAVQTALVGPTHFETQLVKVRLAANLMGQKKFADAEAIYREVLAVREKAIPDSWFTFDTRSDIGAALLGQGKYMDAEPLLVAGYEGLKQRAATIPPPGKPRVPRAADRLVTLYEEWGKLDEKAKWAAERAGLK